MQALNNKTIKSNLKPRLQIILDVERNKHTLEKVDTTVNIRIYLTKLDSLDTYYLTWYDTVTGEHIGMGEALLIPEEEDLANCEYIDFDTYLYQTSTELGESVNVLLDTIEINALNKLLNKQTAK